MLFHSYKPAPPLCDFIESFWLYNGFESPNLKERIFPTGTFELVFNLQKDELRIRDAVRPGRCARFSGAIVSGPYNGFFVTDTAQEASVMGVHFKPGGAYPFLGFPTKEFADSHVDLDTIWGRGAGELREQLCTAASSMRRFRLLERALLGRLFRPLEHHPAVSLALDTLDRTNARAIIRRLAREAGLSDRRFIDVFRFEVGLNPKVFNRMKRFQHVLAVVHRVPAPDWAQLASVHGYFDQSHLIRDFLAFSGFSPAEYLRKLNDLRRQGLRVKFNHLPVIP